MADSSKTEKATPKKRRDERKKGNVFFSNDAVSVAVLLASFFVLKLTATPMVEQIYRFLQYAMGLVAGAAHTGLQDNLSGLVLEMLKTGDLFPDQAVGFRGGAEAEVQPD